MDTPSPGMQNTDAATASTASGPNPTSPTADEERTGRILVTYVFERPVKAQEDGGPWVQELLNSLGEDDDVLNAWDHRITHLQVFDDRNVEVQHYDYSTVEAQPDGT